MSTIKLLVLYQGHSLENHPGYHDGFKRLVSEGLLSGYKAIPYFSIATKEGWPALWSEATRQIMEFDIDAVFIHFFHNNTTPDPTEGIELMKACPSQPLIFTSLGDPFGVLLNKVPKCYQIASRLADINFLTGMGSLAKYLAKRGSKNLILMPNGVCQVRFSDPLVLTENTPEFDVVFIGSRKKSRYLIGSAAYYGFWRDQLVKKLTKRFGKRLGLYGYGWDGNPSWQGTVSYNKQHEVLRKGRVQIGGYPNSLNDYYTSDRVFIALASGIPFVDYHVPGVECIFKNQNDWWLGNSFDEMIQHIDYLLEMTNAELLEIGEKARQNIMNNHTQYHRCKEMISIIAEYRSAKQNARFPEKPVLPFLKYENEMKVEAPIINWKG